MHPAKKEFIGLLERAGWSQAEAARQLHMTSGGINQIVNPDSEVKPSTTTLQLLRLVVASKGVPVPELREGAAVFDRIVEDQGAIDSRRAILRERIDRATLEELDALIVLLKLKGQKACKLFQINKTLGTAFQCFC